MLIIKYVGKTGRNFNIRIKEHKNSYNNNIIRKSAYPNYSIIEKRVPDFNFSITSWK